MAKERIPESDRRINLQLLTETWVDCGLLGWLGEMPAGAEEPLKRAG